MSRSTRLLFLLVTLLLLGCTKAVQKRENVDSFTLLTYNVDNLFDTKHDAGFEDFSYLPIEKKKAAHVQQYCRGVRVKKWRKQCYQLDWSHSAYRQKIRQIGRVLRFANADVVLLQEVENKRVLKDLLKKELNALGYDRPYLFPTDDKRGVRTAILTRLPVAQAPRGIGFP